MLDYQRVVDDLRSAVYSSSVATMTSTLGGGADDPVAQLRNAAAEYRAACDEANRRLRLCGNLLRQGLRAEAIQQAEIEPNLLDVVSVLDFPDRDQLAESLRSLGLAKLPPLDLEVAAELNEAYSIQQPLESLLKLSRLQAIGQYPLLARIKTLRQIAEVDADNPVWRQDLIEFERVRLKEIQREGNAAVVGHDVAVLEALAQEVAQSPWTELPPRNLIRSLEKALADEQRRHAREQLGRLEGTLNGAFAAFDLAAGRAARAEWNRHLPTAALEAGDPLLERAQPALDWLQTEDAQAQTAAEHQAAVAALEAALDSDEALPEKRRLALYHAATRHGPLPEPLERRFQLTVRGEELTRTRRSRLMIAAVVALVVATGLGIAGYVMYRDFERDVAQRVETLRTLIDAGKLSEAQTFLDETERMAPDVAGAAPLHEQRARLQSLQEQERARAESFAQSFDEAAEAVTALAERWAQADKSKVLDEVGPEAARLGRQLDELMGRATAPQEQAQLLRLRAAFTALSTDVQRTRDQLFADAVEQLAAKIRDLEESGLLGTVEYRLRLDAMRNEVRGLAERGGLVSESLRSQVRPLESRLDTLFELSREMQREAQTLELVTAAIGQTQNYRNALSAYAKQFPQQARSLDFQQAVAEEPAWLQVLAWNEAARQWNQQQTSAGTGLTATGEQAGTVLAAAQYEDLPGAREARTYLEWSKGLRPLETKRANAVSVLRALFSDRLLDGVYVVEYADGRKFYSPGGVKGQAFEYYTDFQYTLKRKMVLPADPVKRTALAPQAGLAAEASKIVRALPISSHDGSAERRYVDLLRLVCKAEDVDPMLRLMILRQLIVSAMDFSPVFETALKDHRMELDASGIDWTARWMLPNDSGLPSDLNAPIRDAETARSLAARRLPTFMDLPDVAQKAAEGVRLPTMPAVATFRWIGALRRDAQGQWRCDVASGLGDVRGKLLVFSHAESGTKLAAAPVGQIDASGPKIEGAAKTALVEGRPVWLLEPAAP